MPRTGDPSPVGRVSATQALAHFAGNTATGGIWRVHGETGTAVLKLATPNGEPATEWNHWLREPLAYSDGFIDRYRADSGITAPRLLHTATRDDGTVELWLEDVDGTPGEQWSITELGRFATRLGALQARWRHAADPPPWLSRHFLRRYTTRHDFGHIDWDHPVAARHWPRTLRESLRRLWDDRFTLLDRAESLPTTVCHLDVWPKNLFARGDESILIDWAFIGHGAVGEDIGNLIPDTVLDGLMDVDLLDEIRETVTTAYIDGHHTADGDLPAATIRQAIAVTGAAKYTWLAPMMLTGLTTGRSPGSASYDPDSDTDEILRRRRRVLELLVDWSHQAT